MRQIGKLGLGLLAVMLLNACAGLANRLPSAQKNGIQEAFEQEENRRAESALAILHELEHTDVLIRLNNDLLAEQMQHELSQQARAIDLGSLREIEIGFGRQYIGLSALVDFPGPQGETLTAVLLGDIRLSFSGNHLIWLPQFHRASLQGVSLGPGGGIGSSVADSLLNAEVARANREVTDAVIIRGRHTIPLDHVPMGRVNTGVLIDFFSSTTVEGSRELGGVFTVAGAAILIDPDTTSVALDLEFVPNISSCTPDLTVSRAGFAREIRNREPVGVSRFLEADAGVRYFYTEIRGANRETAVVHYWFADGKPVGLEELAVGASERWRTWSAKTIDRDTARNWEVVVVERDTGCILHSQAIRSEPDLSPQSENRSTGDAYAIFESEFRRKLTGFSILENPPEVADIEIERMFMGSVLRQSLRDINIVTRAELTGQNFPYQGSLAPFVADTIACEPGKCESARICENPISRCARRHDTRDCTTCLFRNPLNNRCVNEVEDPICVAARASQNLAFESARESCMRDERADRRECERRRAQEVRSCSLEAASLSDACIATRDALEKLQGTGKLASIEAEARPQGYIDVRFTGFELTPDMSELGMSIEFRAELTVAGVLDVQPLVTEAHLVSCISAWQGAFQGQVFMPSAQLNLLGSLSQFESSLVSSWSGFVVPAKLSPAPLEALFLAQPEMLADCQIGLTVDEVSGAITGEKRGFFQGRVDIEVRPLPSQIVLSPASVQFGERVYRSEPTVTAQYLSFRMNRSFGLVEE